MFEKESRASPKGQRIQQAINEGIFHRARKINSPAAPSSFPPALFGLHKAPCVFGPGQCCLYVGEGQGYTGGVFNNMTKKV